MRFYGSSHSKGWHQNVIDPDLPPDHPDKNRHLPARNGLNQPIWLLSLRAATRLVAY